MAVVHGLPPRRVLVLYSRLVVSSVTYPIPPIGVVIYFFSCPAYINGPFVHILTRKRVREHVGMTVKADAKMYLLNSPKARGHEREYTTSKLTGTADDVGIRYSVHSESREAAQ